jgi:hypothetical protein
MRYLEFDFFLEHENDSKSQKESLGYQDKLDATGLLCALSIELNSDLGKKKRTNYSLSKITMKFYDCEDSFIYDKKSKKIQDYGISTLRYDGGKYSLENLIVDTVNNDDTKCYLLNVPNEKLGYFGLTHDINVGVDGYVCIVFYANGLLSRKKGA